MLNKIDLISDEKSLEKITKKLQKTLESTVFKNAPIVPMSCLKTDDAHSQKNAQRLIETLLQNIYVPSREAKLPFLFAVDHCFSIKGQGAENLRDL